MTTTITRDQAKAFLDSLHPIGDMAVLSNHTRTFFEALVGRIPQDMPYRATDMDAAKLRRVAEILRGIAAHIEVAGEHIGVAPLSRRSA